MAFPNVSDIIATTIDNRSRKIADNVSRNNAFLTYLERKGNKKTISGGSQIMQELSFAENGNAGYYSGYDLLPVAAQDVLSAAVFDIKQAACPVTVSGLELLQNAGKEQIIDLLDARIGVAEKTMANLIAGGVYADGTHFGGKEIDGLDAAVSTTPASASPYGGIVPSTWTFWQNKYTLAGAALTSATIQAAMNTMWSSLVRGSDRPELILMDAVMWNLYISSLQANQRFTDPNKAKLGFSQIQFMDCDCVLDGGIGGFCTPKTQFWLNLEYLFYRPHASREFVSLSPSKRYAINQDAEVQIMAWAGNLTCSGRQFQGRLVSP